MKTTKKMGMKVLSLILVMSMLWAIMATPVSMAVASHENEHTLEDIFKSYGDGTYDYVSLGASNTNGYGHFGYLPGDVSEDPLYSTKGSLNVYGYLKDPANAYPAQIQTELQEALGGDVTVNLNQLAISSMRVEELLFLLDETYVGDEYLDWRFYNVPEVDYPQWGNNNWFVKAGNEILSTKGEEVKEYDYNWYFDPNYNPSGIEPEKVKTAREKALAALRGSYQEAITNADLITFDLGWNNFGVYAFNNIKNILDTSTGYDSTRVALPGEFYFEPDWESVKDVTEKINYESLKSIAFDYIKSNTSITDEDLLARLDKIADVLAYTTIAACYHYDSVMEKIYELNPDAQVVVINIQNLADDMVIEFGGMTLELGDLYGYMIELVNNYRRGLSPYADKYMYANAGVDGDVTTFLDEIIAWNGDPTTLTRDMKDLFDMYDDNLYVRSIVEYMMVGQALSGLFDGFRDMAAGYGLEVFKDSAANEPDSEGYVYEFALTRTVDQLLSLNLSKLDLQNPAGPDADIEYYGKAIAQHLKNLRGEEAANVAAYDYVFENLLAGLTEQQTTVEGLKVRIENGLKDIFAGINGAVAASELALLGLTTNYTVDGYYKVLTGDSEAVVTDETRADFTAKFYADYTATGENYLKNFKAYLASADATYGNMIVGMAMSEAAITNGLKEAADGYKDIAEGLAQLDQAINVIIPMAKAEFANKLQGIYNTYHNTLNYAYDVVATYVQAAANINNISMDPEKLGNINSAATAFAGTIANDFINGAMNKFYYELEQNGVQATGAPAVPDFEIAEGFFDDPATRAIACLWVHFEIGSAFFAHPNVDGHTEIKDAVLTALVRGTTAKEDFDNDVTAAWNWLVQYTQENYPELYSALLKVADYIDSPEFKTLCKYLNILYKEFDAATTAEEKEKLAQATYKLIRDLQEIAAMYTEKKLDLNEIDYYVSLGDSTINGYGLDGYIDDMQNGVNQVVSGSAHVLLAQKLFGDEWKENFANFCQGSLRADDLLLFLGGDVELDDYYYAEIEPNLMEGTLEATQQEYIENVANADLISVAIGGGNFLTFAGKYVNKKIAGDPYTLDWERIGIDMTGKTARTFKSTIESWVPLIGNEVLADVLPEGVEIENPGDYLYALLEGLVYGYASYRYYYYQVLERIHEINPDAHVLVLGIFNPVDEWSMTINIGGKDITIGIGDAIGALLEVANVEPLVYAVQNENATYVDISETETILEAANPGKELGFSDYFNSSFQSNGKAVHASVAGHVYIADQMYAGITHDHTAQELATIAFNSFKEYCQYLVVVFGDDILAKLELLMAGVDTSIFSPEGLLELLDKLFVLIDNLGDEFANDIWDKLIATDIIDEILSTIEQIKLQAGGQLDYVNNLLKTKLEAQLAALKAELADLQAKLDAAIKAGEQALVAQLTAAILKIEAAIAELENILNKIDAMIREFNIAVKELIETVIKIESSIRDIIDAIENEANLNKLNQIIRNSLADLTNALIDAIEAADLVDKLQNAIKILLAEGVDSMVEYLKATGTDLALDTAESLEGLMNEAFTELGDFTAPIIADLANKINIAINKMVENAITSEYLLSEDSSYLAIGADSDGFASLLADKLLLSDDAFNVLGWDEINAEAILKADLITLSFNEKMLNGFAVNQTKGYLNGFVYEELKPSLNAYAVKAFTEFFANANPKPTTAAQAELIGMISAMLNQTVDSVANSYLGGATITDMDWASLVGAENVKYVDEARATMRKELLEAGVPETMPIEIPVLDLFYANLDAFGDAANFIKMFEPTDIYAMFGENAVYTVEVPVLDALVFAGESYAYGYAQFTKTYTETITTITLINPNALVVLLGHYNAFDGIELDNVNLGEIYGNIATFISAHPFAHALLNDNVIYVDIAEAETVFGAYATTTEVTVLDFISAYLTDANITDLSVEGNEYVCSQILKALNIICAHFDLDKDHACDYGCDVTFGKCEDTDNDHACDYGCDATFGICEDEDLDHSCDYGCGATFGTCEDKDLDHDCDYGCDEVFGNCVDTNNDHACDYGCDEVFGECADNNNDHECDYACGATFGKCEDTDNDHACDYGCGATFGDCVDTDNDHDCDYGCDVTFGTCEDADLDHDCDYGCDKVYGTCEDKDLDHDCDYGCDKVYGTCVDEDLDHDCDYGCDKVYGTCEDKDLDHDCDYGCDKVYGTCEDKDLDHACDYGCDVTFGKCEDKDFDHACDYGCDKVYGTCEDKDLDHDCDYGCDKVYGTCEDADLDHDCDYGCDKVYGTCVDEDLDHNCDYGCDKVYGTCEDTDNDHTCDYGCDVTFGKCEDKDFDHACDYGCDATFGDCVDTDNDHACDYGCDATFGKCEDTDNDHACDYGCNTTFGTCEDKDFDHACDYGCDVTFGKCEDTDNDHACDYGCDATFGKCEDKDFDHACDYGCDATFGKCEDTDNDHACDYGCDATFGTCEDKDLDHDCDYGCDVTFGKCEDTDNDHACDYGCDVTFGKCEDTDNDHYCDYCGTQISNCEDNDSDEACDICGAFVPKCEILDEIAKMVGIGVVDATVYVAGATAGAVQDMWENTSGEREAFCEGTKDVIDTVTGVTMDDVNNGLAIAEDVASSNINNAVDYCFDNVSNALTGLSSWLNSFWR